MCIMDFLLFCFFFFCHFLERKGNIVTPLVGLTDYINQIKILESHWKLSVLEYWGVSIDFLQKKKKKSKHSCDFIYEEMTQKWRGSNLWLRTFYRPPISLSLIKWWSSYFWRSSRSNRLRCMTDQETLSSTSRHTKHIWSYTGSQTK